MTARIIPFPSRNRVRLVPVDADHEYLSPPVRKLMAMMEATERAFGSSMPPKGISDEAWRRAIAPYLVPSVM
jgi:hypothetical protein